LPAVFTLKRIGVTSLTFLGHATSVTWPFDNLFTTAYWWSYGTKPNAFRDIQWRMWRNGWHDL